MSEDGLERGPAGPARPSNRRLAAAWVAGIAAALLAIYLAWGAQGLENAGFTVLGIAGALVVTTAVGFVATRIFGHTPLADAIVLLGLIGAVGFVVATGYDKHIARREAEANIKRVAETLQALCARARDFRDVSLESARARHPDLALVADGPSTGPREIGVGVMAADDLRVVVFAAGRCWAARVEDRRTEIAVSYLSRDVEHGACKPSSFPARDFGGPARHR